MFNLFFWILFVFIWIESNEIDEKQTKMKLKTFLEVVTHRVELLLLLFYFFKQKGTIWNIVKSFRLFKSQHLFFFRESVEIFFVVILFLVFEILTENLLCLNMMVLFIYFIIRQIQKFIFVLQFKNSSVELYLLIYWINKN